MISLGDITSFDVIVTLLFLLFVIRGTWIGFMRQLAFFLALVISYVMTGLYTGQLLPHVSSFIESPKAVFFISFGTLFLLSAVCVFLFGKVLNLVMEVTLVNWFDRLLGFILGVVKAYLVISILYMIMSSGLSSANELAKKSITSPYILPGANAANQLILDPQMRKRFQPREPAITPDPEPPGQPGVEVVPLPEQEIYFYEEDQG